AMILTATATGTATISYQWKIDNQNITGAVNSTYSVSAVDSSDAGTYTCVATNLCGSVLSTPIVVGINQSPTISSQSAGAIKCVGSAFSFSVNASGTAPLQYQWYKNASAINGAINNLYILNSVDTSDAGTYYCVISNGCGSVTSTDKVLSIKQAPAFVSQSNSATKCEGESMLFSVSVSGSSPLNYQWYSDTGQVYGANANSYTLSNILTSNAGNYYCTVSNSCGSIVSTPKTLTVRTAPSILSQSNSDTLCQGESMLFNMNVNGSMPISYQWYKNQNSIVGALNNIYMIPSVDTIHAGIYHAVATNSCGSVQTSNINLLINKIVQISSQSGDSSRCEGESVQLSVSAAGTTPISYQWYKSGIAQIGLNSPQIALANLSGADAGSYYCNVANICNSVNSSSKTIIVHANPQIDLGIDTTFCLGGQVVLSPGFGFNCLWSNGSFNNQITVTQTGDYWVNATNQYGCQGNSDTINVNVVLPYAGADICMAGVDSATQKNVVVWEKTPNVGISSYNIYRESSVTGVWNLIENKPFDSLGVVFDMTSNPVAHADRYAISVIDSCGNESAISTPHKTMHLAVSQAVPSGYNLLWNGYQGFQVASYRIWRADTTQVWTLVDSVNGNIFMWHDTISAQIPLWYQVEVIRPGGPCNPTKANTNYNTTRSNQATNGFQAPNTLAANFIATPTHGQAPLVVMFFDQTVGNPTGWYWNFGDGTTSTQQNPAHQYDSIGIYDVTLTVTNNDGVNSYTKFGYIDVVPDGIGSYEEQFAINVFPNPFKDDVNIVYELNYQSDVVLEVFNTMGQRVFFIPTSKYNPGKYNVSFSAQKSTFGEGLYYLRITINDKVVSKKLVQIK
ncbi:MAG: immunoglobulin domain-containing protein, partial [Bacteroidales bacterium]|nr:immunoglobulin domain-containing protein [Bacteroidales bacterium]